MSGKTPLVGKIEGYTVAIFKQAQPDESAKVIFEEDLRLSRIGGAHVENPDDLIILIEDAVFKEESS